MQKVLQLMDRLVGKVVGEVEAGACVPSNGDCCMTPNYIHGCYGNCHYFDGC